MIYCANCSHCKVFIHKWTHDNTERSIKRRALVGKCERRVRCDAGYWTTSDGCEKHLMFHRVLSRTKDRCPDYDSMGSHDLQSFLASLKKNLPKSRILIDVA